MTTVLLGSLLATPWLILAAVMSAWLGAGWVVYGLGFLGVVPLVIVAGMKVGVEAYRPVD